MPVPPTSRRQDEPHRIADAATPGIETPEPQDQRCHGSMPAQYHVASSSDMHSGIVLITGHPRSGTHYTAKLLRQMGYRASIEGRWMSRQTCFVSSWKHAQPGDFRNLFYSRSLRQDFDRIIHQVRHPLEVIASSSTLVNRTVDHIRNYVEMPEPSRNKNQPLTLCMRSWIGWNQLIEARADWRFQLEELPEVFPEFCRQLGIPEQPWPVIGSKNTRRHTRLGWEDLERADAELAAEVRHLARRYGYDDA